MKTYDETFERVMAERDSYMRRKKERKKQITTGSIALAGIALAIVSAFAIKNRQQLMSAKAEDNVQMTVESVSDYTAPEILTEEITSFFGIEESTRLSAESEGTSPFTPAEQTAESGKRADYDSMNETQTVAPATASERAGAPSKKSDETTTVKSETAASMNYTYSINSGKYKNYCPGRVIEKDKVGEKIGTVTVTGYWEGFGAECEGKTQKETLSADVYYIKGVSDDVAVCLKFNDKGDALTTDHYYVVINPNADYSSVIEYVIGAQSPSASAPAPSGEYTVAYTVPE